MSRIGRLPVPIPDGVTVSVADNVVTVEGPKGLLTQKFQPQVQMTVQDGNCIVSRRNETKKAKSLHGLYRKLVSNMVIGVSQGFNRELQINGVGYRAEAKDETIVLNLGFSNQIEYRVPEGVTVQCDGPAKVTVSGIDNEKVGQVAAEIRSLRPPEPYKGKGIRYSDEIVRRKVGKSGVK